MDQAEQTPTHSPASVVKAKISPIQPHSSPSLGAGLPTGVGALPVLFMRKASEQLLNGVARVRRGRRVATSMFICSSHHFIWAAFRCNDCRPLLAWIVSRRATRSFPICIAGAVSKVHRLRYAGYCSFCSSPWRFTTCPRPRRWYKLRPRGVPPPSLTITIGIGLQNLPECLAIDFPADTGGI